MADEAPRFSELEYSTLLDAADDVVFLLDAEQRYIGIWGRWITEHGLDRSAFLGKTSWEIFGAETREVFEPLNDRVLAGEAVTYDRWFDVPWGEHVCYLTSLTPMRDPSGDIVGVVGVGRDITKLKRAEEGLAHLAMHDPMTELPNRTAFQHAVERATSKAERGTSSALMFLDVDNFKSCNDVGGHRLGDIVLREIAAALRDRVREPDIVARIGGDEFGVLLEGVSPQQAVERAGELADAVRELGASHAVSIDLSVGIVAVTPGLGFDAALAQADSAMYRAKEARQRVFLAS